MTKTRVIFWPKGKGPPPRILDYNSDAKYLAITLLNSLISSPPSREWVYYEKYAKCAYYKLEEHELAFLRLKGEEIPF